jgi:transcriptional regulator GlxA family with amidase domain
MFAGPCAISSCVLVVGPDTATGLVSALTVGAIAAPAPRPVEPPRPSLESASLVSLSRDPFQCGNGIAVSPELTIEEKSHADIIVVPELWLAPDDDLKDRYLELKEWLRQRYRAGNTIYSACSGAVLLAASGLLNGKSATSHWGYADLFRRSFPAVRFIPEPNIVRRRRRRKTNGRRSYVLHTRIATVIKSSNDGT